MGDIEQLRHAIGELESKRDILGDQLVDAALAPMKEKLAQLVSIETSTQQLKYVSILFADVSDSTKLGKDLDPEDLADILGNALRLFAQGVERCGGNVVRYLGDGIMAIFGIPTAQEDDAERAVQAGLEILDRTKEYAELIKSRWGLENFNVRVGVYTGQIYLGGEQDGVHSAMGIPIHLAQRMQISAPVGGLLIAHSTYRHVRGLFDLKPQPLIKVKGMDKPIRTYLVMDELDSPSRVAQRGVEGIEPPLVGRELEFGWLKEALADLQENVRTHQLTLIGETGIGKTRLIDEFIIWVHQLPAAINILEARASRQNNNISYGLVRELVSSLLEIHGNDPPSIILKKLESGLRDYLEGESLMKAHFIGSLLGFDLSSSPFLSGVRDDPAQLRDRGIYYFKQFIIELCRKKLTIAILDDIQWADSQSLELIDEICETPNLNLFVICLARPEFITSYPDFGRRSDAQGIVRSIQYLNPLSRQASNQLLDMILYKVSDLPEKLRQLIHRNAEGNPYFIEELVNIMIEDGVLERDPDSDQWIVVMDLFSGLRVPPTLTYALQSRLDKLPKREREVLQVGSVFGRIFWDKAIVDILGNDFQVQAGLESLLDRDMIYPRPFSSFGIAEEFIFKQEMLRDVVYQALLKSQRLKYHAKAAKWLEEISAKYNRQQEYFYRIAEHWEFAEQNEFAINWLILAANQAKLQGALEEAEHFLGRALDLTPISDRERQWQILLESSKVAGLMGNLDSRNKFDQSLLELALYFEDPERLAEVYYRQGTCFARSGQDRIALQAFQNGLDAARQAKDQKLEALILAMSVVSLTRLGDLDKAEQDARRALEIASGLNDEGTLARALTNASIFYGETGDLARAAIYLRQQVEINRRNDDRTGAALGLNNLGYIYIQLGMFEVAQQALRESRQLSDSIGARRDSAYSALNLALAYYRSGELHTAAEILEGAIPELIAVGDRFGEAAGLSYQALVQENEGELDGSRENFSKAGDIFTEIGVRSYANDTRVGLARCALRSGRYDDALEHTRRVCEYLDHHGPEGMEFPIWAYLTCAQVFESTDLKARASDSIDKGYQLLMERAARISEEDWRKAYLENIPEHVTIRVMWQQTHPSG